MNWRFWRQAARRSLVARLLLAQVLVLCLLWFLVLVFVVHDASRDEYILKRQEIYEAWFTTAESLESNPAAMRDAMRALDAALRGMGGLDSDIHPWPVIVVEGRQGVLYRSGSALRDVPELETGRIVRFESAGASWRARALESPRSGVRVTIVMPADGLNIYLTLASRGTLVLPLLISLPFLFIPAWVGIRTAKGPWRRAMADLATRGAHDLRPLPLDGRPGELVAMFTRINALLERVRDSADRERTFIADAAHELRTPLAAMRVNVEALQRQATDPRQQQLLDGILNGNERATRLVSQLLRLMRSDATVGEEAENLCFDALVQERMAALSGIADARGVELELSGDSGLQVAGRREGLVSLVDNLLDNAIKYSPQEGKVHADLRREAGAEASHVVLRITDQGPGIAPELRERVFDRFFRDPRQAQSQAGSGLGLAIALAVARQHGGSIELDAAGSMGLCVTVRLPAKT